MIDEYRACVEVCSSMDYADTASVKKCNTAVDRMYAIVEQANTSGRKAITDLATLLDEPATSKWLSHQLVERAEISQEIRAKCISIVKNLAKGNDADALGERMWLKEYAGNENR
jgi:hypothetical protein